MSLDLYLEGPLQIEKHSCEECEQAHLAWVRPTIWQTTIMHTLNKMFEAAGVYHILWHGSGLIAKNCMVELLAAKARMIAEPERFKELEPPNGWGSYDSAMEWLSEVIEAFQNNPEAALRCSI